MASMARTHNRLPQGDSKLLRQRKAVTQYGYNQTEGRSFSDYLDQANFVLMANRKMN
jgi:hypothetical protein